MFTQCRGCGEIFGVTVDDLVASRAQVRCSSCGAVFNALETLAEYKPQDGFDLILNENDNPPPLLNHEFKPNIVPQVLDEKAAVIPESNDDENRDESDAQPEFVADKLATAEKKASSFWVFSSIALVALLLWQAGVALKKGTIKLPESDFKDSVCELVDCYVTHDESNLNSIALVSRSIRQHPGRDNALIITAGIINSDKKTQVFPALEIKMSNLNGEIVAMRRFLPSEYLVDETIEAGMFPNTLIPVTLELQSPGKNAVTFEVGFSPTYGAR